MHAIMCVHMDVCMHAWRHEPGMGSMFHFNPHRQRETVLIPLFQAALRALVVRVSMLCPAMLSRTNLCSTIDGEHPKW